MSSNIPTKIEPAYSSAGYDHTASFYLTYAKSIQQNYTDLSNNIEKYKENVQAISANPKYDYSGNSLQLPGNKDPTILDAVEKDTNIFILQENTAYIIGSITMATLLIFALIIGSR